MRKIPIVIAVVFTLLFLISSVGAQPELNITSPPNESIIDTTPWLNLSTNESSNITYNWDGEGNISGCRECQSYNTTYGEYANLSEVNLTLALHFNQNYGNKTYDDGPFGLVGDFYMAQATLGQANWTTGKFGYGTNLNGSSQYWEFGYTQGAFDYPYTIMAWIYPYDLGVRTVASKSKVSPSVRDWSFWAPMSGNLWFKTSDGTTCASSGGAIADPNKWYHVAFRWDTSANRCYFYVNGTQVHNGSFTPTFTNNNDQQLRVGVYYDFGNPFKGIIDELIIFNRTLSEAEIAAYYNKSLGEGPHNVTVWAENASGTNETTQYFTVVNDTPDITIDLPQNVTITDTTPELNLTTDTSANITYNWDGEGNISGCRECTSYNTTFGEVNGSDPDTVLLLHFNEDFGNITYDESQYGNNGTRGNASGGYQPTWTSSGRFGNALDFDGSNDFVNISYDDSLNTSLNMTVMAWVNFDSPLQCTISGVIIIEEGNDNWDLRCWPSGFLFGADGGSAFGYGLPEIGRWYHVAGVYNGTNVSLYVNGELNATDGAPNPIDITGAPFYIGSYGAQSMWMRGKIDEVIIINRSLSASEIQEYYNRTLSEGAHNVTVWAANASGTNETTQYFTVDTTPPSVTIDSPTNTTYSNNDTWFNATVVDNLGANWTLNVTVQVDGVNYSLTNESGNWNYHNTTGLPDGSYNAQFFANDSAGNMNDTEIVYFTVDTTPPTITIDLPPNQSIADNTPDLNLTTNESSNITYNWDGEGNISGCRECQSYNTTYGEANGSDPDTVLLLHFNENTSNITYDDSNFSNNGTLGNATGERLPTWTTSGRFGNALEFNPNEDDYVNVSYDDSLNTSLNMTAMAWIYFGAGADCAGYGEIIRTADDKWDLRCSTGLLLAFLTRNPNAWIFSTGSVEPEKWHHVAGIFNGTDISLYVNGVLNSSTSRTAPLNITGADYEIGFRLGLDTNSKIDEVIIINRSLSASEIQEYYNRTLNEGARNVTVYAKDIAGNENSTTQYFTVDTTPPSVTIDSPTNTTYSNNDTWFNATVVDTLGANWTLNVTVQVNGVNYSLTNKSGNWNYHNTTGLPDGSYNAQFFANDSAGNMNSSEVVFFTVDTTPPTITIDSPTNISTSQNNRNQTWINASFNEPINYTTLSIDFFTNNLTIWRNGNTTYNRTWQNLSLLSEAVAFWTFDEGSGNTTYDSNLTSGNNGTFKNQTGSCGGTACPSWTDGYIGSALEFDGVGDYVEIPDSASLGAFDEITVSAWVKLNSGRTTMIRIVSKQVSPTDLFILDVSSEADNRTAEFKVGGNTPPTTAQGITLELNTWYHLVGTWNGSTVSIYVNGSKGSTEGEYIGTIDTGGTNLTISRHNLADFDYVNGTIDEVMIFNRSLTLNEVLELYNNGTIGEGSHNFILTAQDNLGNSNTSSVYYTVDTTPPTITINYPLNTTISDATPLVNVTFGEPVNDSWWQLDSNGTNITLGSGTSFEWNLSQISEDGSHNITIWANDSLGNENSSIRYWTQDTTPPSLTITSPLNQSYSDNKTWFNATVVDNLDANWTLNVTVQVGDPVSGLKNYSLSNNSGNWNWQNDTGLPEGSYNTTFFANDSAGNMNVSDTVYFTVDTTSPTVTLNEPVNNYNTSSTTITFNFTADDDIDVNAGRLFIDGVLNETVDANTGYPTLIPVVGIPPGVHQWNVTVNDSAGNDVNSGIRTFTVDITSPSVTFIVPALGANLSGSIYINVTVIDANTGVSTVFVQNGTGGNWIEMSRYQGDINNGNWSVLWDTITNADGTVILRINATDFAGSSNTTVTRSVKVDNTLPSIEDPADKTVAQGATDTLDWNVTETNPDTYIVLRNDSEVNRSSYQQWVNITEIINTSTLGDWIYTLVVNDTANNTAADEVLVTITLPEVPPAEEETPEAVPRVVVLSNNIDKKLATDFFGFLRNRGIRIIHVNASQFDQDKRMYKDVIIIGGHKAYDGVGDIVKEILTGEEQDWLEEEGNRKMFTKTNVWRKSQVVYILAGSDRDGTAEAHKIFRGQIVVRE